MSDQPRPLDAGITTDLSGKLSYGEYLGLAEVLDAQHLRSQPAHHDEMLFIVQHQVAELWMKLMLHELAAAIGHLRADRIEMTQKILARVKLIQRQLFEQWAVLETLTPAEYLEFRQVLDSSSGFQSLQYRQIEFMLGNKQPAMLKVFEYDPAAWQRLQQTLHAPSLYDEVLAWLARQGHAVPASSLARDASQPYARQGELLPVFKRIYEHPAAHWQAYSLCEQLMDIGEAFQLWRFRHLKTVERIIGHKPGTGGSSGVAFLRQALEQQFFPELLEVRTQLGAAD